MADVAPFAAQCCPFFALRALTPAELAALDRWCARALDDPDAELEPGDEAAVARYEALMRARALRPGPRTIGRPPRRYHGTAPPRERQPHVSARFSFLSHSIVVAERL